MPQTDYALRGQLQEEIQQYLTQVVPIGDSYDYSQHKLIRRISLFANKIYPTGKFDSQGNYKYWFDIISPRVSSEVKNIDLDTKNLKCKSDRPIDELPALIANLANKQWLKKNGQSEEINAAVEEGSGWGNIVWKRVKKSYERSDLRNLYVINQTAKSLDETPVIERHQLSQSDLRAKMGTWEYVAEVIKECKLNSYKSTVEDQSKDTTVPYYDIYERNGEVCLKDLKECKGEEYSEGDEDKYVQAKIIGAGTKGSTSGVEIKYVVFAEEMPGKKNSDIYKEFHRGPYKGRWFREGLYELLFDVQVRANQIGNQIAQGLEFASKTIFASSDKLIVQNILTDLKNGDVIRTQGLTQVNVRMEGFDQLANEYNRIIELANDIANSREVVMGNALPSGTTLGAYNQLNANANKLFVFIQEKLAIPFSQMFEEWLIPEMLDELKVQDVVNLTGDSSMMDRVRQIIVDDWYIRNLIAIGPHTTQIAVTLKDQKMQELKGKPELLMSGLSDLLNDFKKYFYVDITGESTTLEEDTQTLVTALNLEADPLRRSAMLDIILKNKGFDVAALPKSQPPQPMQPQQPTQSIQGRGTPVMAGAKQ